MWKLGRTVSHTNQHFDKDSPVAQSIGTVPERFTNLNAKIDANHEAVLQALESLRSGLQHVTVVRLPSIDQHQERQDTRLAVIEGR